MKEKIEEFIRLASPPQWVEYSQELKDTSELIWAESSETKQLISWPKKIEKPGLSRVYFLIAGYSIENLLKGLLISEDSNHLREGKISREISSGHRLDDLASKIASLSFSKKEIDFLKLLSDAIPSWSRYPIPKRWEHVKDEKILAEQYRNQFLELWDKIGFKIYELTKDGWEGPNGEKLNNWRDSYFEGSIDFDYPPSSSDD